LNNSRILFFMFLLCMLGSCGGAPAKLAATQEQAASACSARAGALFPGISDGEYELIVEPHIQNNADGHFVFEQDGLGNPDPSKPLLVCEGNLRNRLIESITLGRDLRRAPAGQSWSF
jgi:hypothetical protein